MTLNPETRRKLGQTLIGYTALSGLICLALVSAAPQAVQLIAGDAFAGATAVLPGLAFAATLAGTHFILSMGSVVSGGAWMVATSSLAGAIIQVLVTAIVIEPFGLWGVGVGAVIGRAASVGILAPRVTRAFGRSLISASCVLMVVAVACLLIGLTAMEPTSASPDIPTAIGRKLVPVHT
jgi:O-antigen/teichoic acid export membrane protein